MVNELTEPGRALEQALQIARQIVQAAPMSVRYAKLAASRGGEVDFHTGYMLDLAAYNVLVSSQDRLEGVQAFNERRAPRWRNG
jgi:enoyl-CoA hydratase/carnithine racemase